MHLISLPNKSLIRWCVKKKKKILFWTKGINYSNEKSRKVAEQNGYSLTSDIGFSEFINEEMSGYMVFEKENEFYKENTKGRGYWKKYKMVI